MTHFNVPIEDYFPWYTYSNDLTPPKLNDELRKVITKALPSEFGPILSIWFGEKTYDENTFIDNRELVPNPQIIFYRTGLEFMTDKQISVNTSTKIGSLYLSPNCINFSVDNWLDLEKQRLFYLLGIKEKAQEYLQLISTIQELNEIVDYHKITLSDIRLNLNAEVSNFENLQNSDIIICEVTPESVIETIRNYEGSNNFYNSLKSYLNSKGQLTTKQIEAASKTIKPEIMKSKSNQICIKIEESTIYGDRDKIDEIKSLIYRMEKMGYRHKSLYDYTVIYK
jgi:hypothetical protein